MSAEIAYCAAVTLSLPAVFAYSRRSSADRSLADLSYPVYLAHLAVIYIVTSPPLTPIREYRVPLVLLFTITAAILLHHLVVKPIDRLRQARVDRSRAQGQVQPNDGRKLSRTVNES